MAGLLALLGELGGRREDGSANTLTRLSDAMHTEDALRRRAAEYQDKLAGLAPNVDFSQGIMANMNTLAAADPTILQDYAKGTVGSGTPSAIREYQYFSQLPVDQQAEYLRVKRAQQVIDTGANIGTLGPDGGFKPVVTKELPPEALPETKRAQAAATAQGTVQGSMAADKEKKARDAANTISLIDQADKILNNATSGRLQQGITEANKFFGRSTDASKADADLQVIGAALTANVPRFEGPQSDKDTEQYRQAAGDVANPLKPIDDRKAALKRIREIQSKYLKPVSSPEDSSGIDAKLQKLEELRRLKAQQGAR